MPRTANFVKDLVETTKGNFSREFSGEAGGNVATRAFHAYGDTFFKGTDLGTKSIGAAGIIGAGALGVGAFNAAQDDPLIGVAGAAALGAVALSSPRGLVGLAEKYGLKSSLSAVDKSADKFIGPRRGMGASIGAYGPVEPLKGSRIDNIPGFGGGTVVAGANDAHVAATVASTSGLGDEAFSALQERNYAQAAPNLMRDIRQDRIANLQTIRMFKKGVKDYVMNHGTVAEVFSSGSKRYAQGVGNTSMFGRNVPVFSSSVS